MCVLYIYMYVYTCVCVCVCVSEVHGIRIHVMNDFLPTHLASSDALGPAVQVPYSERLFQALAELDEHTLKQNNQKKTTGQRPNKCCWSCQSANNSCSVRLQNAHINVPWLPDPAINRGDPPALFRVQLGHHLRISVFSHSGGQE